ERTGAAAGRARHRREPVPLRPGLTGEEERRSERDAFTAGCERSAEAGADHPGGDREAGRERPEVRGRRGAADARWELGEHVADDLRLELARVDRELPQLGVVLAP